MDVLAGPFAIVALVLAVGGVFKLVDPVPTQAMFATLGLPDLRILARGSGVLELLAGVAALVLGGRAGGAIVTVAFVAFAMVTARLLRVSSAASCGCFGRYSAPATGVHVAANAMAAALGATVLVLGVPSLTETLGELPAAGLPFVALVALGTWLFVAVLTVLPDALVAARRTPVAARVREFEIRPRPPADR